MNLHSSLRFGNIVKSKSGIYLVVTEIMASGITYDRLDGTVVVGHAEWGEIEPVVLTEDVLERCGFNTRPEKRFYIFHNERVLFEYWLLDGSIIIQGGFLPAKIKYLHQLQNLFYDLTGTELKITL